MKDKAGPEKLQGYWILELGELAGMRKTDVEVVKSFISRSDDKYRASYGVNVESHPRQCIIVGSTNAESGFLRDITGNRRFWPVRISGDGKRKAWQMSVYDVEQIWAETLVLYAKGEKLYLEGSDVELATNEQADAMESDEREGSCSHLSRYAFTR
jgi:putative DNA primase/helicase